MYKFFYLTFIGLLQLPTWARYPYQQKALEMHNQLRRKHQSSALTLGDDLDFRARKCANHYAKKRVLDNSCPFSTDLGENVAGGYGEYDQMGMLELAIQDWTSEGELYNYNTPGLQFGTGHFTQMIWRKTRSLGVGYEKAGNFHVLVALYRPKGNTRTSASFKENVKKPQ